MEQRGLVTSASFLQEGTALFVPSERPGFSGSKPVSMGHTLAVPMTRSWEGGPREPLSRTEMYLLDDKTLGFQIQCQHYHDPIVSQPCRCSCPVRTGRNRPRLWYINSPSAQWPSGTVSSRQVGRRRTTGTARNYNLYELYFKEGTFFPA
jgi:hypothetical protein